MDRIICSQTMCFFYANYLNDLFWRPTKVSPGHIALGMVPGLVDCDPCLVIGCCRNGETLSGCWERQMVVILNREPQRKGSSECIKQSFVSPFYSFFSIHEFSLHGLAQCLMTESHWRRATWPCAWTVVMVKWPWKQKQK